MSATTLPLSPGEKALWHAVKKLADTAFAAVERDIHAATGLSGADFAILSRIEDRGTGVLDQRELRAALGWDKSRLSHQLKRMEGRRLLRRATDAGTSRLHLLALGRDMITAARPIHAQAVRRHVLDHISPGERDAIIDVTDRLATGSRP